MLSLQFSAHFSGAKPRLQLGLWDGQFFQLQESSVHLGPVSRQVDTRDNSDHLPQQGNQKLPTNGTPYKKESSSLAA